jgi:hypothetical protein
MKYLKNTLVSGVTTLGVLAGVAGVQTSAQAAFLQSYTGYSVFASPDPGANANVDPLAPDPDSRQCAFCDSTVSFSVWQNESGSLLQDLAQFGVNATNAVDLLGPGFDDDAEYIYLYQVVNTNPLTEQENDLFTFDLAVETWDKKPYFGDNPYTSAGYLDGLVFQNASRDTFDNPPGQLTDPAGGTRVDDGSWCIDGVPGCPGNWTPDVIVPVTPIIQGTGFAPVVVEYGAIRDDEVERQQLAQGKVVTSPTNGLSWQWSPVSDIIPEGNSYLLFATSDGIPHFPWAKTQSAAGEGSSGDVVGVKTTPEPGTVLGLLAVSGLGLVSKRKKQK